jgi:hypothetical protein
MSPTLGMTGMDPATESSLKAAFEQANARLQGRWRLAPEAEADYVAVDMDSMYGPMSWLRLHAAGKQVVGLTSARRSQTDFHLPRPFDANALAELLQSIDGGAAPTAAPTAAPAPAGMAPAPVPQDELPEEHRQRSDEEQRAPGVVPGHPGSADAGTLAPATVAPPAPPPPPPPRERRLGDWFAPGALSKRMKFARAGGPDLVIDPVAREYFGPAALKPIAGYFDAPVEEQDFLPVDAGAWSSGVAALGPAQPLARLQWYGGLLAGGGSLLPGFDAAGRYKLSKWPQTEREYPKHFRIATAMMKGPATLDEVAAASGVPLAEVVDFVNASLATGYAEHVPEPTPEPTDQAKAGGLFGRRKK